MAWINPPRLYDGARHRPEAMAGGVLDHKHDLLPSLAVVATGLLWGTYWIPIRALDAAGLAGPWATFGAFAATTLVLAPVALARWRRLLAGGWPLAAIGVCGGSAFVLYSNALLLSEIVTVILLFYLTPLWSTLLARVVLRQPITGVRIATIALGLGGMFVILGAGGGLPLPRGIGDWLALASGLAWAVASVGIRKRVEVGAFENTFALLAFGLVMAAAVPLAVMPGQVFAPLELRIAGVAPWLALTALVWTAPTIVLLMWGNARLDPGRVGILLMGEVLVGAASAAILTDEPFGWRQIVGGVLILAAAAIDIAARGPRPEAAAGAPGGDP